MSKELIGSHSVHETLVRQTQIDAARIEELESDRDEWKARAEFSYRQRDELNRLCEFNEKTMSTLQADNARLRDTLENCRLLAALHRKEEWAGHVLRLCESAGVAATVVRSPK